MTKPWYTSGKYMTSKPYFRREIFPFLKKIFVCRYLKMKKSVKYKEYHFTYLIQKNMRPMLF